jgi:hypothetical protein
VAENCRKTIKKTTWKTTLKQAAKLSI